jgi:nicotinamidase-related amidase
MQALIIVDMQKDFCYPEGSLFIGGHVRRLFEPLRRIIDVARKKMPLIFTQDWHRSDDREFKIWKPHCVMNTKGAEVIDELNPQKDDYYIKKRRYSAFYSTDLDLMLRELEVEKIYLAGVVTNICVLHTASDAVLRNYRVAVIEDCTAALSDYDQKYAIEHMKNVLRVELISSTKFLSSI